MELARAKKCKIAVAQAQEPEVIEAVKEAHATGAADFILVGDRDKIKNLIALDKFEVIHESEPQAACEQAIKLVNSGRAQALMKGLVDTSVIMKAVLAKDSGIRDRAKMLSHIAAFELNTYHKLLFVTDAAINIMPDLEAKKQILKNSVEALNRLGIAKPKVALLAAKEKVDPKMPATLDYEKIIQDHKQGFLLDNAIIDGPFALDNAISKHSCNIKGIDSPVGADADLLLCPDIEAGNILYKALVFFASAKTGGVVLGAKHPVILTSRADSKETKIFSIALSSLFGTVSS